jgi:hypothetical protein
VKPLPAYLKVALLAALGLAACDSQGRASPAPARASAKATPPETIRAVHMPGALAHAESIASAATTPLPIFKNEGKLGERLETDLYYFRARVPRFCDATGKLIGVEVEIEAKSRISVSPRDVVIGKGGIAFNASMNLERKTAGCGPLLPIRVLQKGEVVAGFVIFDLPFRPGNDLGLIYQPTRWGGAGFVRTTLGDWVPLP